MERWQEPVDHGTGHRGRLVVALVATVVLAPTAAHALHGGAAIMKNCLGPTSTAQARPGDTITCTIRVTNNDTFGDTHRIDSIVDVINNLGGPTTTPNLIQSQLGVSCVLLPPGGSVTVTHQFVVENSENNPLTDQATATGADLRNAGAPIPPDPACPTGGTAFTATIGAQVDIVVPCFADGDCDDHNPCSIDTCNLSTDTCVYTPGNAGTECRSAVGPCDVAETCDGMQIGCPADAPAKDGTGCDDGNACTTSDACQSGVCRGGPLQRCDDGDACTDDSCDLLTQQCMHAVVPGCVPIFSDSGRTCQATIAKAGLRFGAKLQATLDYCLNRVLADVAHGRGTSGAAAICARKLDPSDSASTFAREKARAEGQIVAGCAGLRPQDINGPCDQTATTISELAACVVAQETVSAEHAIAAEYRDACAILPAVGLGALFPAVCSGP